MATFVKFQYQNFIQLMVLLMKFLKMCLCSTQLNSDHQYLYQMGMSIQKGTSYLENCGIANKSPGELHHARWLTKANRILRLYISKRSPEYLKGLVYCIIAFYIPGWFYIKQHSICIQGAKTFFKLISLPRNLY